MPLSRRWIIAGASAFVVMPLSLAEAQDDAAKRLVGTWRLISFKNASGQDDPVRGPHPIGVIMYDAHGSMAVQIIPDRERPKFPPNKATPDQAQAALVGYTAYFGTYSVDQSAKTVTHHRQGNMTSALGDFVERYEFIGNDRLIMRPVETGVQLTWERVTK